MRKVLTSRNKKELEKIFGDDSIAIKRFRCVDDFLNKKKKKKEIAKKRKVDVEFINDAIKCYKGSINDFRDKNEPKIDILDNAEHQKDSGSDSSSDIELESIKEKQQGRISGTINKFLKYGGNKSLDKQEKDALMNTSESSDELKEIHSEAVANKIDAAQNSLKESGESLEDKNDFLKSLAETEQNLTQAFESALSKEFEKGNKSLKKELTRVSSIPKSVQTIGDKFDKNDRMLNEIMKSSSSACEKIKAQIRTIQELQRTVSQLPSGGEMRKSYESVLKGLKNIEEDISEYLAADIPKRLKSIEQSFDLMQGKLGTIDEIQETLKDKGVSIRQEFPPSKEDEEDIVQLAKYGQKIFDLLTIAARHYARNREDISRSGQEKHAQELRKTRERAINEGISKGRLELVEDLMNKFDLDSLFNRESPMDKTLVEFLKSNGLTENEEFLQGKTMEIDEKNRTQFEAKAKFQGSGTFIVKKSCLELGEKIIRKAELELKVAAEAEEEAKKSKSISDTEKAEDDEEGKLVKNESDAGLETVSGSEEEGKPGKDALKDQNTFQSVSQDQQLRQNADAEGDNNKE